MVKKNILAIDDHPPTLLMYKSFFAAEKDRFTLTTADSGEAALKLLLQDHFDVVILDWLLPETSGLEVLTTIRSNTLTKFVLVFVVTGSPDQDDWALALNCGADDYLSKPFSTMVLKAKLTALLRRRELCMLESVILKAKDLKLSPCSDYVEIAGKPLKLFIKEIELLKVFLKRSNIIIPPETIWDSVWGYSSPNWKHTLETTMSSLRSKLGEQWSRRIETSRGKGYMLNTRN